MKFFLPLFILMRLLITVQKRKKIYSQKLSLVPRLHSTMLRGFKISLRLKKSLPQPMSWLWVEEIRKEIWIG